MKKGLRLADVLVTLLVSIVFGVIYYLWTPMYYVVQPLGFQLDQLIQGVWFMAAVVAFLLIRKPGVGLLAELAAGVFSAYLGSTWGWAVIFYGLLQGLFAELIFLLFRYRRYDLAVAILAGVTSAVASLLVDYQQGYITDLAVWNLSLMVGARLLSGAVLAGVLSYGLVKALEATGVTNLLRPSSAEDMESLDK